MMVRPNWTKKETVAMGNPTPTSVIDTWLKTAVALEGQFHEFVPAFQLVLQEHLDMQSTWLAQSQPRDVAAVQCRAHLDEWEGLHPQWIEADAIAEQELAACQRIRREVQEARLTLSQLEKMEQVGCLVDEVLPDMLAPEVARDAQAFLDSLQRYQEAWTQRREACEHLLANEATLTQVAQERASSARQRKGELRARIDELEAKICAFKNMDTADPPPRYQELAVQVDRAVDQLKGLRQRLDLLEDAVPQGEALLQEQEKTITSRVATLCALDDAAQQLLVDYRSRNEELRSSLREGIAASRDCLGRYLACFQRDGEAQRQMQERATQPFRDLLQHLQTQEESQ